VASGPGSIGRPSTRRRLRRWQVWSTAAVVLVVGGGSAVVLAARRVIDSYQRNITSIGSPFTITGRPQPVAKASAAKNVLVICLDRPASAKARWRSVSASRARFVFLVHVAADRQRIDAVSLPLTSAAGVPAAAGRSAASGRGKTLAAAFDSGGFTLPVHLVERLTQVRLDYVLVIDVDGFKAVVDALGGVKVSVESASGDRLPGTIDAGPQVMDGTQVRRYLEETGADPRTVTRAEELVRAIGAKLVSSSRLTGWVQAHHTLTALTRNLAADDAFRSDMLGLVGSLSRVGPGGLRFITPPADVPARPGSTESGTLWEAIRTDTVGRWAADHPQ
jgi:LCP family protein required for cell wall assembly